MEKDTVVLLACGDVGPRHEPTEPYSSLVRPTLATADIRFAQAERTYSDRGALQSPKGGLYAGSAGGGHSRVKPSLASVFTECNFNVVSLASNHGMDWGEDAFVDTIDLFKKKGIHTIGAGRNLREARQPAIVERNGVRVAFLGYCSVLREGYAAGPDKVGMAQLSAHTSYEKCDFQAGVPPRVVTVPDKPELDAMVEDIRAARRLAHTVVLSLHWGVHYIPRVIAEYQPIVAQAAFDAGVDLILGHHAHLPKAIAVYNGKVCFYSLSNFIMSLTRTPENAAAFERTYGVKLDPEYPHFAYGVDGKRSLIVKAVISREGVKKVSFLPVLIDKQLRPEILRHDDVRFDEMVRYMDWASERFTHKFAVEGDEVIVTG